MNLTEYIDALRQELAVAAEAGGEDARDLAERLTGPLESAARLMLLEALSAAADEITRDLAPGSVQVRLRGREPSFVVTAPPPDDLGSVDEEGTARAKTVPPVPPALADADEGGMARLNLRLPEALKQRIEQAASREGLSLNAWLLRAAAAALQSHEGDRASEPRSPWGGQRYRGWVQ